MYGGTEAVVKLSNATFASNNAQIGGGVALIGVAEASLEKCKFMDNRGTQGGGIYSDALENVMVTIDGCSFSNNFAGSNHLSSGVFFFFLVWLIAKQAQIVGNTGE